MHKPEGINSLPSADVIFIASLWHLSFYTWVNFACHCVSGLDYEFLKWRFTSDSHLYHVELNTMTFTDGLVLLLYDNGAIIENIKKWFYLMKKPLNGIVYTILF